MVKINCYFQVCNGPGDDILMCTSDCGVPTLENLVVDANQVILYGSLVTQGAVLPVGQNEGSIKAWAAGDPIKGIAYGSADSRPVAQGGSAGCANICVILRDARVKEHVIAWPLTITQAQKNAALAELKALGIKAAGPAV
jgi:hypothetical protein